MFFNVGYFNSWLEIFLFFTQHLTFFDQYDFVNAKALIGVNVRPAEEQEFPYVVAIMRTPQRNRPRTVKSLLCTGTLVSYQDVLAAEHCIENRETPGVEIIAGSNDFFTGTKFNPLWWMTYNQWIAKMEFQLPFELNDIVVIKLIGGVNNVAKVAIIPRSFDKRLFGSELTLAGWGKINSGNISQILRTVRVTLMRNAQCKSIVEKLSGGRRPIHKRRLCTNAEPYALVDCGDSGGPLLNGDEIIAVNRGVIPGFNGTFHPEQVNFHITVDYYKNFILDIKNNYGT